jgi:hypothetical protein
MDMGAWFTAVMQLELALAPTVMKRTSISKQVLAPKTSMAKAQALQPS